MLTNMWLVVTKKLSLVGVMIASKKVHSGKVP
jgi:hypothetical protein